MLSAKPGGELVVERIYKAFSEIGYTVLHPNDFKKSVYDANDFGVPQKRERVILLGLRKDQKQH